MFKHNIVRPSVELPELEAPRLPTASLIVALNVVQVLHWRPDILSYLYDYPTISNHYKPNHAITKDVCCS